MPTTITTSSAATASAFSNQRKVDRTSNGVLWAVHTTADANATAGTLSYSTDNGATWQGNAQTIPNGSGSTTQSYTRNLSFFIDQDDYAHVVFKDNSDGKIYYRRGTPNASRTAWTWSAAQTFYVGAECSLPDVTACRTPGGTTWDVFLVASLAISSLNRVMYKRFHVSADGTAFTASIDGLVESGTAGVLAEYSQASVIHTYPSIDFNHTGDGKTVAGGTPHLYVGWSVGKSGAGKGIRYRMATYSAGSWTWGTEREIDSTRYLSNSSQWLNCLFDGTRVILAGQVFDGTNLDVVLYEKDAADAAAPVVRVLLDNAATADRMWQGSASYDADGNVYLFGFNDDEAAGSRDLVRRKWTRSSAALGAETVVDPGVGDAYVSAKRGYSNSRIEWIYTDGTASPYTVTYDAVLLNVAPTAATGLAPDAVTFDRALTQRFSWTFNDPDAGDSQSKYDLQYRQGTAAWTVVTETTTNRFRDFPGGTFAAGDWEWQVRTYDSQGVVGPWSASAFFTAANAPAAPSITEPVNGSTVSAQSGTVRWSTPSQTGYRVRTVADNAGSPDATTVYSDTGLVVSSDSRVRSVTFPVNNRHEHVQVQIEDGGLLSAWSSVRVLVSYTPPAAPSLIALPDPAVASIQVHLDPGAWPVAVSTPVFTGTGTGTMTGPTATAGTTDSHSWTATLTTAATDGGTFTVAKDGVDVGTVAVGAQFSHEGLTFTINDGATDFAVGDKFSWSTTAVKTTRQDVWVRVVGDAFPDGQRLAKDVLPSGVWTHRTPLHGKVYEYRAVAYGDNGTSSEGAWTA